MSLALKTNIIARINENLVPRLRSGVFFLPYHTQTIHLVEDDDKAERCQLISFRPPDNGDDLLPALTVNDASRGTTAFNHLRNGRALVYKGGDYHNARQLLQTIKRKCAGTSGSQKRRKRRQDKTFIRAVESNSCGASSVLREQWMHRRQRQREQAALVNRLLIQVSLGDGRPNQIMGLKRTPKNAKDILSFAFQNDQEIKAIDGGLLHSRSGRFLLPLNEFLAMIGGYEWYRKGVYVEKMQDRVFPHFGVFPPTRQDHIPLLEGIDRTRQGPVHLLEVGIGSGVLSAILLRAGRVDVAFGTDVNPRAVACAHENLWRLGLGDRAKVVRADLFPPGRARADVVLFNPPWIPGYAATWLDQAVFDCDQSLLRRFLSQVRHHLNEDGRVYLLLSNLGELLGLFQDQDLHTMFREGNLELVGVRKTEPRVAARAPPRKAKVELRNDHFEGIEDARNQEVISLYHLRVKM